MRATQACRDGAGETIVVEIPDTIARGGRSMVAVWSSRQITRCVLRYVVGVSIAVVLRDDKTSHASIVAVVTEYISVPYHRIMFANPATNLSVSLVYSIRRYNHTYN